MPKGSNNINTNEQRNSLFEKGIQIIARAFNEQENYFTHKILELNSEITNLKEENLLYKTKLSDLQNKIKTLSKTVCQIDIDNAESSMNTLEKNSTNSNIELSSQKKINNNGKKNIYVNNENINNNNKKSYSNIKSNAYKNALFPFSTEKTYKPFNTNYDYNDNFDIKKLGENQQVNSMPYYINNENNINASSFDTMKINNLKIDDNEALKNLKLRDTANSNIVKNSFINNQEPKTSRDFKKKKFFSQKCLKNANNFIKNSYDNKECESINYNNDLKVTNENNTHLYQKLNEFLTECKKKLTAEDYDKMIDLLKAYESDSNFDFRKKVINIISNNRRLVELFEDIFES